MKKGGADSIWDRYIVRAGAVAGNFQMARDVTASIGEPDQWAFQQRVSRSRRLRSPAFDKVAALATRRAQALDEAGEPLAELEALAETGLLTLPFSPSFGGGGLACGEAAARILPMALRVLGRASSASRSLV